MVFTEIVQDVMDRLNLTSDEAAARIGREVNARYRRVTSSIGLTLTRRVQVSKTATIGNRNITFSGIEKIEAVIDKSSGKDEPLTEITPGEMIVENLRKQPPDKYSIYSTTQTTVTIRLNSVPTTAFTLYADGLATVSTLGSGQSPAFAESFHDILVYGVMADEYNKMEKPQLSQIFETSYENRLSDLRMFIAKSLYLDIYPGKSTLKGSN